MLAAKHQDKTVKPDNGALRYNEGKPRVDLIPGDALLELAKVYDAGAKKYAERNWERGMDWSKCYASLQRHSIAFWSGQDVDQESGLLHAAQMVWNAMALLTYQLRGIGRDDRHVTIQKIIKAAVSDSQPQMVPVADPMSSILPVGTPVEIKVGLRFRTAPGGKVWEVSEVMNPHYFKAKIGNIEQMMSVLAIKEIVT